MPPIVALCLCGLFILWLIVSESRRRGRVSGALWIPLTWAFLLGSKPVSLWLGVGESDASGGLQDKLVDKALFLSLIAAGLVVLAQRRASWGRIIRSNRWVFLYFLYLGVSVLWSDESFVSFKRWIKDAGNLVMVLVILSEEDPVEAVRSFLARFAYLLIPISVLIIKYYPWLSRRYDVWTNQPVVVGTTTDKNTFGMALFVCGLSLCWILLEQYRSKAALRDTQSFFSQSLSLLMTAPRRFVAPFLTKLFLSHSLLLLMTAWLLVKAQSATAVVCTVLGACVLIGANVPAIRNKLRHLGAYTASVAALVVVLYSSGASSFLLSRFTEVVGRDATLHGRAEIWRGVLKEDINPLIGVGFYSFWSPERNKRLSEEFYYLLGTAHNGYIETYLNSGWIGLVLLVTVIVAAVRPIKRDVLNGSVLGSLRLAFLVTIVVYNVTESAFDRLVPAWFMMLLVMMEYPRALARKAQFSSAASHSEMKQAVPAPVSVGSGFRSFVRIVPPAGLPAVQHS